MKVFSEKGSDKEEEEEEKEEGEEEKAHTLFRQTDSFAASAADVICRNSKAEVNWFLLVDIFTTRK